MTFERRAPLERGAPPARGASVPAGPSADLAEGNVTRSRTVAARSAPWLDVAVGRLEPIAVAALSLGAAAIHFGVISEHFAEDLRFGLFFSSIGWFEALWALAFVLRPARWLAALGVLASVATVAVWVWAHLMGLPFGPDAGAVEPTTVTDLMATLFEIVLAIWLVAMLTLGRAAPKRVSTTSSVLAVVALVLVIASGATVALSVAAPAMPEESGQATLGST